MAILQESIKDPNYEEKTSIVEDLQLLRLALESETTDHDKT